MTAVERPISQIVKLLRRATSLRVVGEFLKQNDLPHSAGGWKELEEERFQPALDEGKITIEQISDFLAEVEEFGRSHVFLYRCKPETAAKLLNENAVKEVVKAFSLEGVMKKPDRTILPLLPTVTEIRFAKTEGASLSVKLVETREIEEFLRKSKRRNRTSWMYETIKVRAVNVLRLSSLGILEIRVQTYAENVSYVEEIQRMWKGALERFFPAENFSSLSLTPLKKKLWEKRDELGDALRFSDSRLRDPKGFTIAASTPKAASDLLANVGSVDAISSFLDSGGIQEGAAIWWKKQANNTPSCDVHTLLPGAANEIIFTANSTRADYEYVLAQFTRIGF